MFGIAAVVFFAISFMLHAIGAGKSPWDVTGFAILGLLCLAIHAIWQYTPWHR